MGNIFISYRREDSAGHSGRLFDKLRERFGKDRVFMDIAGIEPGVDFVEAIEKAVGACDAFIVVLGRQWLSATDAEGKRRLDNPEDFIRLELATALRRNIRVIPVLVQGATAPSSGSLPEDLKKLSRLQAHEISDNRWDYDVGTLIQTLEKVMKKDIPEGPGVEEDKIPTPPSPPPPHKFPRWILAIIAAIVVAIGVYALWPRGKPTIEMPNVVGAPFEEAKAILTEKGLVVSKEEKQTHEKPPGIVIDQKPKPGTEVERGQRVDLVLAVKTVIKMPNVVGKRIEEAEGVLQKAGLAISKVKETKTNERSPGIVLSQTPKPGVEVEPGQKVVLEVAIKSGISVPNVIGESFDKAKAILEEMGLVVLVKGQQQTRERPPGTVLYQNPKPGTEVKEGQRIELVLAVKTVIMMPNVVGRKIEEARTVLQKAGLAILEWKETKTSERSPGIVLSQTPEPGVEVEPGQRVRLEVAVKPFVQMPNVIGESFDKAKAILVEKDLVVLKFEKQMDQKPPGTVVNQNPRQGKEVEKGQRVELVIAVPKPTPPPKPLPPPVKPEWRPTKATTFIVPFAAGGSSDMWARSIADMINIGKLSPVAIVVVNKPGGGGAIGTTSVVQAKGDPHMLLTFNLAQMVYPIVAGKGGPTFHDLTLICNLAIDEQLIVVRTDSPLRTIQDVVAAAKQRRVTIAGTGTGQEDQICSRLFEKVAGVKIGYVPFNTPKAVLAALQGGHADMMWANPSEFFSYWQANKVRPIAVAAETRLPMLRDVPTFREKGYNLTFKMFRGIAAPPGISGEAAAFYESMMKKMSDSSTWQEQCVKYLLTPSWMGSREFTQFVTQSEQFLKRGF